MALDMLLVPAHAKAFRRGFARVSHAARTKRNLGAGGALLNSMTALRRQYRPTPGLHRRLRCSQI